MDALSILRQATISGTPIVYQSPQYVCGEHRLEETTKTSFRRTLGARDGGYYQVKDIVFYLENVDASEIEYRKKCIAASMTAVVVNDKASLRQYLNGQIDTCDQIEVAPEIPEPSTSVSQQSLMDVPSPNKRPISLNSSALADQPVLKSLRKDEMSYANSDSVLCKPGVDMSFAIKIFQEHILNPMHNKSSKTATTGPSLELKPKAYSMPIIIIPNAITSMINMSNVKSFLVDGVYIPVDVKQVTGASQDIEHRISNKHNNVNCEFKVIDNISTLTAKPEYWDRVVAVFATGQAWQFKNWKWNEPVNLFQNVLGVHLMFADSEIAPTIQSWNCKIIKISRTQRHLDAGAMNQFWKMLHDYIELNKPWLAKRVVLATK